MKKGTISVLRAKSILSAMRSKQILVVGDVMLDEYLWGNVNRISPEAPVPVVEVTSSSQKLGGAANVALNIKAIGPQAWCVGLCGNDEAGNRLKLLLKSQGLPDRGLIATTDRPTTLKTRIIAQNQQIVRTDRENRGTVSAIESRALLEQIRKGAASASAVIFSDYAKGVLTQPFLSKAISLCRSQGVYIAVDPKKHDFTEYAGASLITPNLKEAHMALGIPHGKRTVTEVRDLGWKLIGQTGACHLLITMGEDGMALFETAPRRFTHFSTAAQHVFDVTGAGDTVISVFTASIAAGATPVESAILANYAAGLTVAEVGTAAITPAALLDSISRK